jgi:exopolyphosphatase/guanosine-5'-triphosphate,3'-diphosphate pyrophosphatase
LAKLTAVIDFGSNSVRLVIFERTSRFGFKIVHESKSRVRIGEGAYAKSGVLQREPMERAFLSLSGFLSVIKAFKVSKTLAVATSALRDAPNSKDFTSRVQKELGINIKVIDGEKEALFGGIACANLLKFEKGVTIDIGGGSTEFALIESRKVLSNYSLDLGTVRLKELFETNNDLIGAKEFISKELQKLPKEFHQKVLIGIGGSLRALAKVIMLKNKYPLKRIHNYSYQYADEVEFINSLISKSNEELENLGFKKERIDVIRWGILIFCETVKFFSAKEILTSGVGIREGIFLSDVLRNSRSSFPANFNPSLRNILDEFQTGNIQIMKRRYNLSLELFDLLHNFFGISEDFRQIIAYSSKLIEIGVKVDFYGNTKSGFYLILNSFIYQVSHKEALLVATLIRFSKKNGVSNKVFSEFGKELFPDYKTLQQLHSIIYLTRILTSNYSNKKEFSFRLIGGELQIEIYNKALYYMINEKIKNLEVLQVKLTLSNLIESKKNFGV